MRSAGNLAVTVGDLEVYEGGGSQRSVMLVPLEPLDGTGRVGLQVVDDGVLWEDSPYGLYLEVESTVPVLRATMSVNEHNDLWTDKEELGVVSSNAGLCHRYAFCLAEGQTDRSYRLPFSLTCGFARVQVRIYLVDGRMAHSLLLEIFTRQGVGTEITE